MKELRVMFGPDPFGPITQVPNRDDCRRLANYFIRYQNSVQRYIVLSRVEETVLMLMLAGF